MMKKGLLALLFSVVMVVSMMVTSGTAADQVGSETVGGFAVKLAAALGSPAADEQAAAAALRSAGVELKADLNARLTEAEAARILADLGMKVAAPANPSNEVSSGVAMQLAAAAGLSLPPSPGVETGDDLPVGCLLERNHGQCTICCKDELAIDPNAPDQLAKFCSQFCKTTEPPPPSDEEPQE